METCFLQYNLKDIDLTKLNIEMRLIDLKIILESSTGSFVIIFFIFLLIIKFKKLNDIHSSILSENILPTQDSMINNSMNSSKTSQILLQNIDKNIDKFKNQISSGFAGGYLRDRVTTSSGVANASFL